MSKKYSHQETIKTLNTERVKPDMGSSVVAVSIFPCLKEVDIPEWEKEWLSKTYSQSCIEKAVRYVLLESTEIKTTLIQCLKWACKNSDRIEIPVPIANVIAENKSIAQIIENVLVAYNEVIDGYRVEVLSEDVQIFQRGGMVSNSRVFKYESKDFVIKIKEFISCNLPTLYKMLEG